MQSMCVYLEGGRRELGYSASHNLQTVAEEYLNPSFSLYVQHPSPLTTDVSVPPHKNKRKNY
jgi:hypothetical protein